MKVDLSQPVCEPNLTFVQIPETLRMSTTELLFMEPVTLAPSAAEAGLLQRFISIHFSQSSHLIIALLGFGVGGRGVFVLVAVTLIGGGFVPVIVTLIAGFVIITGVRTTSGSEVLQLEIATMRTMSVSVFFIAWLSFELWLLVPGPYFC